MSDIYKMYGPHPDPELEKLYRGANEYCGFNDRLPQAEHCATCTCKPLAKPESFDETWAAVCPMGYKPVQYEDMFSGDCGHCGSLKVECRPQLSEDEKKRCDRIDAYNRKEFSTTFGQHKLSFPPEFLGCRFYERAQAELKQLPYEDLAPLLRDSDVAYAWKKAKIEEYKNE